jgi:hypothetical protein
MLLDTVQPDDPRHLALDLGLDIEELLRRVLLDLRRNGNASQGLLVLLLPGGQFY